MVHDKHLAIAPNVEHDLVKLGIVFNAVHMIPELRNLDAGAVDVNLLRMVR